MGKGKRKLEKKVAISVVLALLLMTLASPSLSVHNVAHTIQASTMTSTYDVTIEAYCLDESAPVSVRFRMDGKGKPYKTPHTLTNLTGTHTFTVRDTDPNGHPFRRWNTGETSTTITVNEGGTYTAYYGPPPQPIRIGVFGPMYWSQGQGMVEGATLAMRMINAGGGIAGHTVELYTASTHPDAGTDPTSPMGYAAATELMTYDVDYVLGGFRTDAWFGARTVLMDNQIISFITGSATNELIDCGDGSCGTCVRDDYARYKYMFRNTPVNSTMLLYNIAIFLKVAMATKLMPLYTGYTVPLKIAVVSESAVWADMIHAILSNAFFWNYVMGMNAYGGVDVVYEDRIHPVDPAGVPAVISAVGASDARLLIEVISGPVGRAFAIEWSNVEVDAALAGIDVAGQEIPAHWTMTGGGCEYELILAAAGGRDEPEGGTPINTEGPVKTQDFYRDYYKTYDHAPIYTSYGAFDTLMGMKEAIEEWVGIYGDWGPGSLHDDPDYDKLIPIIEQTDRHGLVGWFKYTSTHDVWTNPFVDAATWPTGYTRPLFVEWQAGILEVVWPMDQPYSKIWAIPHWMYPYPTDVDQDGDRDITDIAIVSYGLGTSPGEPRWQFVADVNRDGTIDGDDLDRVSWDYGQPIPIPLG